MNILAKFRNNVELISYTTEVLNLLVQDSDTEYILIEETGEVIWKAE